MQSSAERIRHYLTMAKDLRVLAARSNDPETSAAYLELAAMWVRLADEAGLNAANDPEAPPADVASDARSSEA